MAGRVDDRRPADWLYRAIVGTAVGLAVLLIVLFLRGAGPGPMLVVIPWLIPVISLFQALILFSVGFLALGRYSVLKDAASFWIGMGAAGFAVALIFYAFTGPGLLPGGVSVVARLPGTSAWFLQLGITILGTFLPAAVLLRRPGGEDLAGGRLLLSAIAWIVFLVIVFTLVVLAEQFLPALITPSGVFTEFVLVWNAVVAVLFAGGAFLSTRHYLRTNDAFIGYVAFAQTAFAFALFMTLSGMRRYDLEWYLLRAILTGGGLVALFGLFYEYVQLFRHEKEKTAMVLRAEEAVKEREEQLRNLIENSADGIIITDEAGRITTWNRGMEMITGLAAGDVLGMPAWEVQSWMADEERSGPDPGIRYRASWDRLLRDGTLPYRNDLLDVQIRVPAGDLRYLQQRVFTTKTRRGYRVGSILRDVTDRTRAEENLKRHTEDLARAQRDLGSANREANLYLDILSHDLGNTNNVANLYADLLADCLDGEAAGYAEKLRRSVGRSIQILGTVGKIRRIHHAPPGLTPVELEEVVQREIDRHPGRNIRYGGGPTRVLADDLLPEVFSNLIGNAVKFGGPDVEIAVETEEEDGAVTVSVEDTGPGIPDDRKEDIFHLYEQQKRGVGEGLGLYLVQILVQRYGGRIWADDRVPGHPEEGAAFRFTLKIAAKNR